MGLGDSGMTRQFRVKWRNGVHPEQPPGHPWTRWHWFRSYQTTLWGFLLFYSTQPSALLTAQAPSEEWESGQMWAWLNSFCCLSSRSQETGQQKNIKNIKKLKKNIKKILKILLVRCGRGPILFAAYQPARRRLASKKILKILKN